ncbi:MAG: hypothetical protein PHY48_14670 [Candidatus Cloacimonetes bacterium]|nr:hypothetical protein [Candidatus Cloacimonadota bacterium]
MQARLSRGFGLKTLFHGFGANVVLFGRYAQRPYIAFIGIKQILLAMICRI